jgi:hypothetical protein
LRLLFLFLIGRGEKMRASEKHEKDQNRTNAMYSIIKNPHQADPDVVERFERSPYYPVLNFDKGVVKHDGPSRWEED